MERQELPYGMEHWVEPLSIIADVNTRAVRDEAIRLALRIGYETGRAAVTREAGLPVFDALRQSLHRSSASPDWSGAAYHDYRTGTPDPDITK